MPKKLDPKVAEAVMLKAGLKPLEPFKNPSSKWKCLHIPCGNIVYPIYASIMRGRGGCKPCGDKKSGKLKRLPEKKAVAVMLKAGYKALETYTSAHTKWKCLHIPCGNIVDATYHAIRKGEGCCLTCQHKESADRQRKPDEEAIAIMLQAKLEPQEPYINALTPWKCKCLQCGNIVMPRLGGIISGQGGCLACGFLASADKNRIPENEAIEIMLQAKLEPKEPYFNSHTPWKCKCLKCGKIVTPRLTAVVRGEGGCKYCAGNYIDSETAEQTMILNGYIPQEPYINSGTKWKCIHITCGKIVFQYYSNMSQGMGGCKYCAILGINVKVPSYLYLITHSQLGAHKVGIGNARNASQKNRDRLGKFRKFGWEIHKVWDFETGEEALEVEEAVFQVLRKELKLPSYLSREQMPKTRGETETVDADEITLLQLEKIIKKVIKGLQE